MSMTMTLDTGEDVSPVQDTVMERPLTMSEAKQMNRKMDYFFKSRGQTTGRQYFLFGNRSKKS